MILVVLHCHTVTKVLEQEELWIQIFECGLLYCVLHHCVLCGRQWDKLVN